MGLYNLFFGKVCFCLSKYDISILLAGVFWGVIGLFTRYLNGAGVDSAGVLILRSGGCAVLFLAWLLLRDPRLLRIRRRDAWLFFCFGVLATFLFTSCYYRSIDLGSLSAACTLMYSAPTFVMIISLFVFGERFTRRKLIALVCAVAGCALVSGILEGGARVSPAGAVFGLLAGVGYAFYTVCIKALSNRGYDSLTINFYGWALCTLTGLIVWGPAPAAPVLESGKNLLMGVGLIVVSGFLPALLYSLGLRGTEAGKGAVMASVEPVVASLMGFIAFQEAPTPLGILGIILVLGAVILLNLGGPAQETTEKDAS